MAFGSLEFELLRSILGAAFLASGLPDTAQNSCRCGDSRQSFQIKLLNVWRQTAGLPATAEFSWRPGDSDTMIALKLLRVLGGQCVCNFSFWSLWLDILEQARLNAGLPDTSEFAFRFGDTRNLILQKLLNVLNAAPIPIPPEPPFDFCCPPPIGMYGSILDPVTLICQYGSVIETPDCFANWGSVI